MILSSPWTSAVIYITPNNEYIRGYWYPVYAIFALGLPLAMAVVALLLRRRKVTRLERRECVVIASYVVLPLIGGISQVAHFGINAVLPCLSLSTLLIYMSVLNRQQSIDDLTKLNNRGQLDNYMDRIFVEEEPDNPIYFLLIDINRFKAVNDTYGHLAGDHALRIVAESLKQVFQNKNCFLSRYGGDEFAVLLEDTCEESVRSCCKEVNTVLAERVASENLAFQLSVSIGYALYGENGINSIDKLIKAADAFMYKDKDKSR